MIEIRISPGYLLKDSIKIISRRLFTEYKINNCLLSAQYVQSIMKGFF